MRGAIRGRSPFFRPRLPAVLVENNNDVCPTDKDGRRLLPDGSQWVVSACVRSCSGRALVSCLLIIRDSFMVQRWGGSVCMRVLVACADAFHFRCC
jgi:hypothetical protein